MAVTNIKYDVPIPAGYSYGRYSGVFYDWYNSEHKSMMMEFETLDEAKKMSKSVANILCYKGYEVRQKRIGKKLYWEKMTGV